MKLSGLDWLRGIAAFGIVGCHIGLSCRTASGAWVTALCNFNVGLFAAISGFLTTIGGDGWGYACKRAKRLLPIYIVWSIVYIIATAGFDIILDGGCLNERYYRFSSWMGVLFCGSAAAHLWFLICLFYCQILLMCLVRCMESFNIGKRIQNTSLAIISILLLVCSVSWKNWYCLYPIRLMAFLVLGYVMKGYKKNYVIIPAACVGVALLIHLGMCQIMPSFVRDYLLTITVIMLFVSSWFKGCKAASMLAATTGTLFISSPEPILSKFVVIDISSLLL